MNHDIIQPQPLQGTGERYIPEMMEGVIELEHIHRYLLAAKLVQGKRVLDIASGEGYGSDILALVASHVTGVDISEDAVFHAKSKYQRPNLEFQIGSAADIPLISNSVDVVVSFETIEHHDKHEEMMSEIKRVLAPEGVLIISSPNKRYYSVVPNYVNQYHVKELFTDEFERLLKKFFGNVQIFGQRVVFGSLVIPQSAHDFAFDSLRKEKEENGLFMPVYDVAIASDLVLPKLPSSLFEIPIEGTDAATYLTKRVTWLNQAVAERDVQISNLNQAVAERDSQIASLNQAVAERDSQIASLNQAVAERDSQIASLNHVLFITQISRVLSIVKKTKYVWGFLVFLASHPRKVIPTVYRLLDDCKSGDMATVKRTIRAIPQEIGRDELWRAYSKTHRVNIINHVIEKISHMESRPLISILLPAFFLSRKVLVKTLDSVVAQLYPNWELCFSGNGSTQPYVRQVLEDYARRESRIRVSFQEGSACAASATNRALAMVHGSYVVMLEGNVKLEKQALFRIAESILIDAPDIIYSDEVLMSEGYKCIVDFVFRPAFSLELLRSHPYIMHLVTFRTDLLRKIGGYDETLSTSHSYDLILRAVEKSHIIVHIPEVLFLSSRLPDLDSQDQQGRVMNDSSKILQNHLVRCGEVAEVSLGNSLNFFEIRYPLQKGLRVAIIIPTKNHGDLLRQCVESIERTAQDVDYDIIVIDHESDNVDTIAYLEELGQRHQVIRYFGPFNFSAINNWAVTQLKRAYSHYLFCNNDVEAREEGWLTRMLELGQKPDVGIVGAALFYPDGKAYQHAGVCVGMYGVAEHFAKFMDKYLPDGRINPGYCGALIANHELSAVTAACLLMRRDTFDAIGGFDEDLSVGFGDVDMCLRARMAGYRVIQCARAALIHHESYTRGKDYGGDPHPQDSALFTTRWRQFIEAGDPFFNPNLDPNNSRWLPRNPLVFNHDVRRRIFDSSTKIQVRL